MSKETRERAQRALKLHREGKAVREIGVLLGVDSHRAGFLIHLGEQFELGLSCETEWWHGLDERTARALVWAEFTSRAQVEAALAAGLLRPGKIENIGRGGIERIHTWLGIPVPKAMALKPAKPETLGRAAALLRRHGYIVIEPSGKSARDRAAGGKT